MGDALPGTRTDGRPRRSSRAPAAVTLAAGIALLGFATFEIGRRAMPQEEPPGAPWASSASKSPLERAFVLRVNAKAELAKHDFVSCHDDLVQARALDPEGDTEEWSRLDETAERQSVLLETMPGR
jgi:hypothetical protein